MMEEFYQPPLRKAEGFVPHTQLSWIRPFDQVTPGMPPGAGDPEGKRGLISPGCLGPAQSNIIDNHINSLQ